jgi:hypothetical protein
MQALGYKKKLSAKDENDPASYETEEQYFERMSGILSLYAAFTQINFPGKHPHGLSHAWAWLARVLNIKPRRITAQLVLTFLEVREIDLWILYCRSMLPIVADDLLIYLHSHNAL